MNESPLTDPGNWEARYRAGRIGWDLGGTTPALARWLETHPGAGERVVVAGCGHGHDALALAEAGYDVTAVDFAPSAIAHLARAAAGRGLPLAAIEADAFAWGAGRRESFELAFERTFLCALPPERREDYAALMAGLLKPGGRLVGVFYTHPTRKGPPFGMAPETVRALLAPHFAERSFEPVAVPSPGWEREERWGEFDRL